MAEIGDEVGGLTLEALAREIAELRAKSSTQEAEIARLKGDSSRPSVSTFSEADRTADSLN